MNSLIRRQANVIAWNQCQEQMQFSDLVIRHQKPHCRRYVVQLINATMSTACIFN